MTTKDSLMISAIRLQDSGMVEFTGQDVARELQRVTGSSFIIRFNQLYSALDQLVSDQRLTRRWARSKPRWMNLPRTRLYKVEPVTWLFGRALYGTGGGKKTLLRLAVKCEQWAESLENNAPWPLIKGQGHVIQNWLIIIGCATTAVGVSLGVIMVILVALELAVSL